MLKQTNYVSVSKANKKNMNTITFVCPENQITSAATEMYLRISSKIELIPDRSCAQEIHTEKTFRNFIKSTRNQIVFTISFWVDLIRFREKNGLCVQHLPGHLITRNGS